MANEATLRCDLKIFKSPYIDYQSRPTSFTATVTGTKGPTPGAISVTPVGVDVDFSELTTPGLCRLMNQDATNVITYGIRDPETDKFYPLGEILPAESYVIRLSGELGLEYPSAGTGTSGDNNKFHVRSDVGSCSLLVEAFEV